MNIYLNLLAMSTEPKDRLISEKGLKTFIVDTQQHWYAKLKSERDPMMRTSIRGRLSAYSNVYIELDNPESTLYVKESE